MDEPKSLKTIVLFRGNAGLGFNIRGGVDNPHIPGDTGIFVTKIRADGAAFKDGTLKEGDKIMSINGDSLINVTHEEAVDCFTKAKDIVELVVQCGAQAEIMLLVSMFENCREEMRPQEHKRMKKLDFLGTLMELLFQIVQKRKLEALDRNNSNNPEWKLSNIKKCAIFGGFAGVSLLLMMFLYKRYVGHKLSR